MYLEISYKIWFDGPEINGNALYSAFSIMSLARLWDVTTVLSRKGSKSSLPASFIAVFKFFSSIKDEKTGRRPASVWSWLIKYRQKSGLTFRRTIYTEYMIAAVALSVVAVLFVYTWTMPLKERLLSTLLSSQYAVTCSLRITSDPPKFYTSPANFFSIKRMELRCWWSMTDMFKDRRYAYVCCSNFIRMRKMYRKYFLKNTCSKPPSQSMLNSTILRGKFILCFAFENVDEHASLHLFYEEPRNKISGPVSMVFWRKDKSPSASFCKLSRPIRVTIFASSTVSDKPSCSSPITGSELCKQKKIVTLPSSMMPGSFYLFSSKKPMSPSLFVAGAWENAKKPIVRVNWICRPLFGQRRSWWGIANWDV